MSRLEGKERCIRVLLLLKSPFLCYPCMFGKRVVIVGNEEKEEETRKRKRKRKRKRENKRVGA